MGAELGSDVKKSGLRVTSLEIGHDSILDGLGNSAIDSSDLNASRTQGSHLIILYDNQWKVSTKRSSRAYTMSARRGETTTVTELRQYKFFVCFGALCLLP